MIDIRLARYATDAHYASHAAALATPNLGLETRWREEPFTAQDCRDWLLGLNTRYYIITESGQWCGSIGASHVDTNNRFCDVGIFIDPQCQRHGFGSVALKQFIDLMRVRFDIEYLEAGALATNPASVRFFVKNGFTIMGTERGKMRLQDGKRTDRIVMGRLV